MNLKTLIPKFKLAKPNAAIPFEWFYVNILLYYAGDPLFPEDFIKINKAGGDRWTWRMQRQLNRWGFLWIVIVLATLVFAAIKLIKNFLPRKRWGWAVIVILILSISVWLIPHVFGWFGW